MENINEFTKSCLRPGVVTVEALRDKISDKTLEMMHALAGMQTEVGEIADILKKFLFQGQGLDKAHVTEELGDLCWYVATMAIAIDVPLSDVLEANVKKLKLRYPNGYSHEASIKKADKKKGDK